MKKTIICGLLTALALFTNVPADAAAPTAGANSVEVQSNETAQPVVNGYVEANNIFQTASLSRGQVTGDYRLANAAITSAGGFTNRGRSTRVQVIRVVDGTMYYRQLNIKSFIRHHDLTQNVALPDGDIVYVPKSNGVKWKEDILPFFQAYTYYKAIVD